MGFYTFITLAIFCVLSWIQFLFLFITSATEEHSVINDQLNAFISASIFDFYFLIYDVYGF